jgi:hypothetical protein
LWNGFAERAESKKNKTGFAAWLTPLRYFLEVLILKDFKSLFPEVLILIDFKSFAPEVLIAAELKSLCVNNMRGFLKIL